MHSIENFGEFGEAFESESRLRILQRFGNSSFCIQIVQNENHVIYFQWEIIRY